MSTGLNAEGKRAHPIVMREFAIGWGGLRWTKNIKGTDALCQWYSGRVALPSLRVRVGRWSGLAANDSDWRETVAELVQTFARPGGGWNRTRLADSELRAARELRWGPAKTRPKRYWQRRSSTNVERGEPRVGECGDARAQGIWTER